ncbi:Short-chain dehydrogenase/reductase family 42E member 1 [Cytospora mali]|uniref:Short-chain dehydrogenase/reductase family 42E member 1 n=1 Tax=Cytospora mali TaxID=578113 RepID=A0A194VRU2_CYTMA|nr:Short-chain dehydrogenase/reductase family 42E member 1 [Valsa mali]
MAFDLVVAAAIAVLLLSLYLYKLNKAMTSIPEDVHAWRPRAWTDEEIRETYERVCKEPIDFAKHLPPKLERRYIVVGGSGLVGGDIVLHLLARGQPPSSIRIVDFSKPSRSDMLDGPATKADYVKTDITDPTSVEAAFSKPWPSDVANLPLTVFHTAAVIRPGERSMLFWDRTRRVNVDGTQNVLAGARAAGADILVATSSASLSLRPVRFLIPPWRAHPDGWLQVCDERDFDRPQRPHGDYFANYAYSKAIAERTVCGANAPGFRTGVIRPGMGIYGLPTDVICGPALREQKVVTFMAHVVQNFVSGWNVSLAHLLFEAALAGPAVPGCAGRPLVVTDAGPPPQWNDFFRAAGLLAATPLDVTVVSPLLMYLLAHVVEGWAILLARVPFLTRLGLSEPQGPIQSLQPAIWTPGAFVMVDDGAARRSVEEGGLGYKGVCTTLEGMCEQIRDWNRSQGGENVNGSVHKVDKKSILEADLVEAHIVA